MITFLLVAFLIVAILVSKSIEKGNSQSWARYDQFVEEEREKYFLYDKDGNLKENTNS